jgi:hypothetical protein
MRGASTNDKGWGTVPDRNVSRAGRKVAGALAASVALVGIGVGVSQAATVPPGSHSGIVVERNDTNENITDYTLQNAGPMTGRYGFLPVGDGEVYAIHWTKVGKSQVDGTGKYDWGRMGSYRNGPVTLVLTGSNYKYTRISITLTQSWYGSTTGPYPPYGQGAHHTTAHTSVAVNDPTTNLIRL